MRASRCTWCDGEHCGPCVEEQIVMGWIPEGAEWPERPQNPRPWVNRPRTPHEAAGDPVAPFSEGDPS